jgi:hypothetical protein
MIEHSHNLLKNILLVATMCIMSTAVSAQEDDKGREIIFTPYLWATSLSGTSTVATLPPMELDVPFSDLLDNLNGALSLHTEFRFNDWVFVIDPTYISLTVDAVLPVPPPNGTDLEIDVDIWIVELWAGYRFAEKWEAIGGLRYQDQDLSISGLPNPPSPVSSVSTGADWTNWFVGLRFRTDLSEKWFMSLRGDVAFAGDSDSNWNTEIYFNRRFGDNKALNLGYRYMDDDFEEPGVYGWDVAQDGPVIGYTWKF